MLRKRGIGWTLGVRQDEAGVQGFRHPTRETATVRKRVGIMGRRRRSFNDYRDDFRVSCAYRLRPAAFRKRLAMLAALFITGLANGQDLTDEQRVPKVVETSPAFGARDVDPGITEIRVVFDTPMSRDGYSFVGGGPEFPQVSGGARWVDAYTCVLPVKLKPDHLYRFGINSKRHKNFRSVWHVPAEVLACEFRTGGLAGVERDPQEQKRLNVKAFDALCDAVRNGYSYKELRQIDWERLFADHRDDVVGQENTGAWTRAAAAMLGAARDVHLFLELDGSRYPTVVRNVQPNWSREGIASRVADIRWIGGRSAVGHLPGGIAYVLIGTWSADASAQIDEIEAFLGGASGAKGVVIDVRPNGGGSETLAQRLAGWFVDEPVVYASHTYRHGPRETDFTPVRKRTLQPDREGRRFAGPVAVLMGRKCMSSCEAFLLMMRQVPSATLVGERSFGSSGNPKARHLPNGVLVYLPSWKAMDAAGLLFEGKGIEPDVVIPHAGVDFSKDDPVLDTGVVAIKKSLNPKQ